MGPEEVAGYVAYSITMFFSTIATLILIAMCITGLVALISSTGENIPLQKGRRVKKLLWDRWGTVKFRKDYQKYDGSYIESYDVMWDQDSDAEQNNCWRNHLRPEPLLKFYICKLIGKRK